MDARETHAHDRGPAWLAVGAFAALALVGIAFHEMWRDELEIWLVARDSGSPIDLLRNLKTQGHPLLWYVLVWIVTRFTDDPLGMQLLSVAIGCATTWCIVRHAPFDAVQRWGLAFGYYGLYEYTVISRHYGLSFLLVALFCVRYGRTRRLDGPAVVWLVLLANTSVQGAVVAAHLLLIVVFRDGWRAGLSGIVRDRTRAAFAATVVAGVAAGMGQVLIEGLMMGDAHTGAYRPGWDLPWLAAALATLATGWLPFPDPTDFHLWNSSVFRPTDAAGWNVPAALVGVALVAAGAWRLRGRATLRALFVLGSVVLLSIVLFVWYGWTRHHGQVFLWWVACCWMWQALPATSPGEPRPGGRLLTASVAVQLAACALLFAADLRHPFSNAPAVGRYLSGPDFEGVPVVGTTDYAVQPINAYRKGAIYYPESDRFGTFLDWGPGRRHVPPSAALEDAARLARESGGDVVLVLNYPPAVPEFGRTMSIGGGIHVRYFARFTRALVEDENFHLLQVAPRPLPSPASTHVDTSGEQPDNR